MGGAKAAVKAAGGGVRSTEASLSGIYLAREGFLLVRASARREAKWRRSSKRRVGAPCVVEGGPARRCVAADPAASEKM